jgi:hypothetical protein
MAEAADRVATGTSGGLGGWFSRHEDTPIPATIDFLVCAGKGEVVLACPSCTAQFVLSGGDVQPYGRIMALVRDHIRMHTPTVAPWG